MQGAASHGHAEQGLRPAQAGAARPGAGEAGEGDRVHVVAFVDFHLRRSRQFPRAVQDVVAVVVVGGIRFAIAPSILFSHPKYLLTNSLLVGSLYFEILLVIFHNLIVLSIPQVLGQSMFLFN